MGCCTWFFFLVKCQINNFEWQNWYFLHKYLFWNASVHLNVHEFDCRYCTLRKTVNRRDVLTTLQTIKFIYIGFFVSGVVWFGLFVHPFSHTCSTGHIIYRLQFTYCNTIICTSTQYNAVNNNTKFKDQLEVEYVSTSRNIFL
jgi:hypothetical protein